MERSPLLVEQNWIDFRISMDIYVTCWVGGWISDCFRFDGQKDNDESTPTQCRNSLSRIDKQCRLIIIITPARYPHEGSTHVRVLMIPIVTMDECLGFHHLIHFQVNQRLDSTFNPHNMQISHYLQKGTHGWIGWPWFNLCYCFMR